MVANLSRKAFTPKHARDNPLIFSGRAVQSTKAQTAISKHPPSKNKSEAMEQKGDLLIRDLCQNGNNSVHDMRVVNTDAKSHLAKTPEKCLQEGDIVKKRCT